MATVAIGDIHGHLEPLEGVLRLVAERTGRGDTVVFLGDYIDRGLDTPACIECILRFREETPAEVVCLLGNHEDWLLRTLSDPTDHTWLLATAATETIQAYSLDAAVEIRARVRAAGRALYESRVALPYSLFFDAMPPAHLEFLRSLRPACRTEDAVCVHGGLDPELGPIEEQTTCALVWGTPGFQHRYAGPLPLVYGHWSNATPCPDGRAEPAVLDLTIGIDGIKYGTLTALEMPAGVVLQSNGERCWTYSRPDIHRMRTNPTGASPGGHRSPAPRRSRLPRPGEPGGEPGIHRP